MSEVAVATLDELTHVKVFTWKIFKGLQEEFFNGNIYKRSFIYTWVSY